ncbi:MAG TPA: hypothetical protein PKC18_15770 [Lacipirellulaceae bacterium]|nr:hypothetical protein [Lacipirellulaceae bacterium]HMP07165.1 hypothetical protein [Lacipirellulaceae bacterium]
MKMTADWEVKPTWATLIRELIDMLPATDDQDTPFAADVIASEFERIAAHLDSLPAEHELPPTDAGMLALAKREVMA